MKSAALIPRAAPHCCQPSGGVVFLATLVVLALSYLPSVLIVVWAMRSLENQLVRSAVRQPRSVPLVLLSYACLALSPALIFAYLVGYAARARTSTLSLFI